MHRKGERTYLSVQASVQFWIDANGCQGTPIVSNSYNGAVQINTWDTCTGSSMTVLCKIKGRGHLWPGPYFTVKLSEEDPLYNFDAAEMIWSFFAVSMIGSTNRSPNHHFNRSSPKSDRYVYPAFTLMYGYEP